MSINYLLDKRTKCYILLVFDMNGFEYTGPFSKRLLSKDDFLFKSRNFVSIGQETRLELKSARFFSAGGPFKNKTIKNSK